MMEKPPEPSIDVLLNTWPILTCFAANSTAGSLINISRTNSDFRAILHGFHPDPSLEQNPHSSCMEKNVRRSLRIGLHQTQHWANLKQLTAFECSSISHTKGNKIEPCRFCSMPICDACIVKSSWNNPGENTFKRRTRYLCPTCWKGGNIRKDHRFPADHVSREHIWRGRNYAQRGSFCSCTAKTDEWLCIACKESQNESAGRNAVPRKDCDLTPLNSPHRLRMECYGLDCTNYIQEDDRDRRRICLWCSKPLARQYGGEDRLRWETRVIEARAINAASRSADIEEWARNRLRTLTMTRREMRGTAACIALSGFDGAVHDQAQFVKHLDAVNYRAYLREEAVPGPQAVWQSKNGIWKYKPEFLRELGIRMRTSNWSSPTLETHSLRSDTSRGGLAYSRSNREMWRDLGEIQAEASTNDSDSSSFKWVVLKARILELYHVEKFDIDSLRDLLRNEYNAYTSSKKLSESIERWNRDIDMAQPTSESQGSTDHPSGSSMATMQNNQRQASLSGLVEGVGEEESAARLETDVFLPTTEDWQDTDSAMLEHALQESMVGQGSEELIQPDEPPPYTP